MKDSFSAYKIIPELGLIIMNFEGKIALKDIISLNKVLFKDDLFCKTYNVLMDFEHAIGII